MPRDLKLVAVGVALVGGLVINVTHACVQRFHRRSGYCQLPLKVLTENTQACQLLGGEPVRILNLDLSQAKFNPTRAKLTVPVRGKKRDGLIYTLSTRPNANTEWNLQYAVMKINENDYKWNVWLHPSDSIESNTDLLPDDVQASLL